MINLLIIAGILILAGVMTFIFIPRPKKVPSPIRVARSSEGGFVGLDQNISVRQNDRIGALSGRQARNQAHLAGLKGKNILVFSGSHPVRQHRAKVVGTAPKGVVLRELNRFGQMVGRRFTRPESRLVS